MERDEITLLAGEQNDSRFRAIVSQIRDVLTNSFVKPVSWLSRCYQTISDSLFGCIIFWVIVAVSAFTLIGWVWSLTTTGLNSGLFSIWKVGGEESPLERVKVALTMIGGIGAVGYLVIKFRERSYAESAERRMNDEYVVDLIQRATEQLASESSTLRIAGAFALADIADKHGPQYHQRVVSILCGYLRTERNSSRSILKEDTHNVGSADAAVESTILRLLSDHMSRWRRRDDGLGSVARETYPVRCLWQTCELDLHGAVLTETVDFSDATFVGRVDFGGVSFLGNANFESAKFSAPAHFENVEFSDRLEFNGAEFYSAALFPGLRAIHRVNTISGVRPRLTFEQTTFVDWVSFKDAKTSSFQWKFEGASFYEGLRDWATDPGNPSVIFPEEMRSKELGTLPTGSHWSNLQE